MKGAKGIEFIPVVLAAVLAFAALIIGYQIVTSKGPSGPSPGFVAPPSMKEYDIAQSFSVGAIVGEKPVISISGRVEKGVLSDITKRMSFNIPRIEEVRNGILKLNVTDSNIYGNLVIDINGNLIYNNATVPGFHSFLFSRDVMKQGDNYIEFTAQSSSWRLWAPTVYIFNSQLSLSTAGELSRTFDISLKADDVRDATQSVIAINANRVKGTGQINVKWNDFTVYQGVDAPEIFIEVPVTSLLTGRNTVEFSSSEGTIWNINTATLRMLFR